MIQVNTSADVQALMSALQQLKAKNEALEYQLALREEPRTEKKSEEFRLSEYSTLKSNGVPKAVPSEGVRSYDEFKLIQDYFYDGKEWRNWMLWRLGVAFGFRAVDLGKLRMEHLLDPNGNLRDRIFIREQKTGKVQNTLITEVVGLTLEEYVRKLSAPVCPDTPLFPNGRGGSIGTKTIWRILDTASKAVGLGDRNLGSHSMRKTFVDVVACTDKTSVDMNAISKVQGLLNHSDPNTTLRYLGVYKNMYDSARQSVSDWILGRSDVNKLMLQQGVSLQDIWDKLDELIDKEN